MKLHTGLLVGLLVACVITTTSAETGSGIILMDVTIQQKAQAIAPPRASLSFTRLPTDASTRGAPTVMHADRHLQAVPPAPKVVKMAGLLANFGPQFT
jgi:hypothetical protein